MGGGRGRLLHILQGYRERVLGARLSRRALIPCAVAGNYAGDLKERKRERVRDTIEKERERVLERISDLGVSGGESYSYYQGRIDALEWILNQLSEGAKV